MDNDIRKAEGTATALKASEVSPVDSALQMNNEYIQALEKQVEVLYSRLAPVSSRTPEEPTKADAPGVRGNSSLVDTIGGHGYRLSSLSDKISRMTRELEI